MVPHLPLQHLNIYFIDLFILPLGNSGKTSHFARSSQTACWRFYFGKPVLPEANSRPSLDCHSQATKKCELIKIECIRHFMHQAIFSGTNECQQ